MSDTPHWTKGARFLHPVRGTGRVVTVAGPRLLVRFDARPAVPTMILATTVRRIKGDDSEPPAVQVIAPKLTLAPDVARQCLEALRLGVVPTAGLDRLTIGRDAAQARLRRLLDGRGAGLLVVEGSYGAGKSHLLELAGQLALREGYGVARASFDPLETPPSHPLRLYRALMADLRWPDGQRGLRPLLERAATEPLPAHRWLSPARFVVQADPIDSDPTLVGDVLDFVSARRRATPGQLARRLHRAGYRGLRPLGLPDYRTFGQVMAHLLSGLGEWSRRLGHRGLVVMLDEAEYVDRLVPTGRTFATEVLRYLAVASLPDDQLAFDPATLRAGGHAAHRALSPRACGTPSLLTIAAITPAPAIEAVLRDILADLGTPGRVTLRTLRPSQLPDLASRVQEVVACARPQRPPPLQAAKRLHPVLEDAFAMGILQTPRQAARFVVEFWDLYYWDPLRAWQAVGLDP